MQSRLKVQWPSDTLSVLHTTTFRFTKISSIHRNKQCMNTPIYKESFTIVVTIVSVVTIPDRLVPIVINEILAKNKFSRLPTQAQFVLCLTLSLIIKGLDISRLLEKIESLVFVPSTSRRMLLVYDISRFFPQMHAVLTQINGLTYFLLMPLASPS